jgi:hypothetical protein
MMCRVVRPEAGMLLEQNEFIIAISGSFDVVM